MRTTPSFEAHAPDDPVYMERIVPLQLELIEVPDLLFAFHRESLLRGSYRNHVTAADAVWPEDALGVSYFQMARLALEVLAPDRDFDLVVFVTATPDCQLTHYAGPLFNEQLPGSPGIMGIGDNGVAGPFTALRLASNHLRHGLVDRVLILTMEQAMLPILPGQLRVPNDSAVAMIVSRRSGLRIDSLAIERTLRPTVAADTSADTLLVQGTGGDFIDPQEYTEIWKPEGTYACTGVWERFASGLPGLAQSRVVLADADPHLPYRCIAELSADTRPAVKDAVS